MQILQHRLTESYSVYCATRNEQPMEDRHGEHVRPYIAKCVMFQGHETSRGICLKLGLGKGSSYQSIGRTTRLHVHA